MNVPAAAALRLISVLSDIMILICESTGVLGNDAKIHASRGGIRGKLIEGWLQKNIDRGLAWQG